MFIREMKEKGEILQRISLFHFVNRSPISNWKELAPWGAISITFLLLKIHFLKWLGVYKVKQRGRHIHCLLCKGEREKSVRCDNTFYFTLWNDFSQIKERQVTLFPPILYVAASKGMNLLPVGGFLPFDLQVASSRENIYMLEPNSKAVHGS